MRSALRRGRLRAVEDDLAPVLPVGLVDLVAERGLELLHPRAQAPQLVLEPQHVLDARQVEPELRRQLLDQPQALDVVPRSRAACRPASASGVTRPFAS